MLAMDQIFKSLNDPARRKLLDSLRARDGQTLTELEQEMSMTRFGGTKHLKILEAAHLALTRKDGRFKYHYLNAHPLQEVIDRWIEPLLQKPVARAMMDLKTQLERTIDMTKPDFMMQSFIRCTQDALWDALTKADQIAAYHFACDSARKLDDGGTEMIRQDGSTMLIQRLIRAAPKIRLEFTFEPNFGEDQTASCMVFLIEPERESGKLTCEHYDIPTTQAGVREGWARHIASLKSWIETGRPLKLAAYL